MLTIILPPPLFHALSLYNIKSATISSPKLFLSLLHFTLPNKSTHFSLLFLNSQQNITQLTISLFLEHCSSLPWDITLRVSFISDYSSVQSLIFCSSGLASRFSSILYLHCILSPWLRYHIHAENSQIYSQLGLLLCHHYLPDIFLLMYNRRLKLNVPKMKSLTFPFHQKYFSYSPIYHRKMHYYLAIAQPRGLDNVLDSSLYFTHASVSSTITSSKMKRNRQI